MDWHGLQLSTGKGKRLFDFPPFGLKAEMAGQGVGRLEANAKYSKYTVQTELATVLQSQTSVLYACMGSHCNKGCKISHLQTCNGWSE